MAKNDKFKNALGNMNTLLKNSDPKTPIQTTVTAKPPVTKVEETRFTVHIPTPLMNTIKDIGHAQKKKIKTMFVEALEAYVEKNTMK